MLKIKKIKPMFTSLITTMDKYEQEVLTAGGLIDTTKQVGGLKEYQTVMAIGESVRGIKVGDLVCINPSRFAVRKHREGSLKDGVITDNPITTYNFDVVEMDNKQYLLLQDRDIEFVVEEWEEVPDPKPSSIIKPSEKKIIV
jgi:co-chaperonin GroES (HSP10)